MNRASTLLLLCCCSCAGTGLDIVPNPNAPPNLPPATEVRIERETPPVGARELARIRVDLDGYERMRTCETKLGDEAKKLGGNFVRVIDEGRHVVMGSWSAPWCLGLAYAVEPPH